MDSEIQTRSRSPADDLDRKAGSPDQNQMAQIDIHVKCLFMGNYLLK